jgi:hypothetical protein
MATPDLTDEETEALVRLLRKTIDEDRYPLFAAHPAITREPAEPNSDGGSSYASATASRAPTEPRKSAVAQTKPYAM